MNTLTIFGTQFALSLVLCALLARWFLAPRLENLPQSEALFWLALPHAGRHLGLVFLVPGIVSAELPTSFAAIQEQMHLSAEDVAALCLLIWTAGNQTTTNLISNGAVAAPPHVGELDDETFIDRMFFGSPETVIEKFERAAKLGVTDVSAWMMIGGFGHAEMIRSIRLMGEHVIPALADTAAPKELAWELMGDAD